MFPSRTNLKLHNFSVTPKLVKKTINNLDLSKASGLKCIPVVVLKNCEPELSYILAELFDMCLKEFSFPYCWKVASTFPLFKNFGQRCMAKNYFAVSLLSVIFLCALLRLDAMHAPQRNVHLIMLFSDIVNQILYLKWAFAIGKTYQFISLQVNLNFQFCPSEGIATQLFLSMTFCAP